MGSTSCRGRTTGECRGSWPRRCWRTGPSTAWGSDILPFTVIAALLVGIAAWVWRRRPHRTAALRDPASAVATPGAATPGAATRGAAPPDAGIPGSAAPAAAGAVDALRIETASARASLRLWGLAFAAPVEGPAHGPADDLVRSNVTAMLTVDTLDPRLFPRRPALMPQLMQAVNDPGAEAERLSRIVAHDPVLTADVLRLANSSLYRVSPTPIETIQRAIVVCGVDGLRGMLAAAMLRPVFRASSKNFPRLPRLLWDRTERAARAAELYAVQASPADRLEAQLVVLLCALGPLVVYGAVMDVYSRNPGFAPNGPLCVALTAELAPSLSLHVARDWQSSPRLQAALENSPTEPLTSARHLGELFGTLSLLEAQTVISADQRRESLAAAGLSEGLAQSIWAALHGTV